jgi:hypothetical protein
MMPNHIAILSSLLGLAATLGTIVIHGFVVHTIVMTLRSNLQRGVLGVRIWVNMTFIVGATLLALTGHLVDIVLPPRWKLLGPFEAVSGMLMFGLTTAFIFAVIQRLIHAQFDGADNFLL